MAKYIHAVPPGCNAGIAKLISSEPDGLVVRYTDVFSAALIVSYVFSPRKTRYGMRILEEREAIDYLLSRALTWLGDGI